MFVFTWAATGYNSSCTRVASVLLLLHLSSSFLHLLMVGSDSFLVTSDKYASMIWSSLYVDARFCSCRTTFLQDHVLSVIVRICDLACFWCLKSQFYVEAYFSGVISLFTRPRGNKIGWSTMADFQLVLVTCPCRLIMLIQLFSWVMVYGSGSKGYLVVVFFWWTRTMFPALITFSLVLLWWSKNSLFWVFSS